MRKTAERCTFYALVIGFWWAVARAGFFSADALPSPGSVFASLAAGIRDGSIPMGILVSLKRIAVGYGLSIAAGAALGIAAGHWPRVENTVGSLMLGLQSLPSICWMPAALLWFGPSDLAIVFVVIMGSVFSIATSTLDGVRNLPPQYFQAARSMGSRGWHLYTDVIIPAALPSVAVGLRQGWSFAWRSLMGAELLFVTLGLGNMLQLGRQRNDMSLVAAVMVVITVIGLAADRLVFSRFENKIRVRWGLARS